MSWLVTAAVAGSALSYGVSALTAPDSPEFTGNTFRLDQTDFQDYPFANPNNRQGTGFTEAEARFLLGYPDNGALQKDSPAVAVYNAIQTSGISSHEANIAVQIMTNFMNKADDLIAKKIKVATYVDQLSDNNAAKEAFFNAIYAQGYPDAKDWLADVKSYDESIAGFEQGRDEARRAVAEGRATAAESVARLQTDFPVPTRALIRETETTQIGQLSRELNKRIDDQQAALFEQANILGANPFAAIQRLEQEREDELTRIAQIGGLERALNQLGTEQSLAGNALSSLQQSLILPLNAAANVSGQIGAANASAGQIAASQAMNKLSQLLGSQVGIGAQQAQAENMAKQAKYQADLDASNNLANMFGSIGSSVVSGLQFNQLLGALGPASSGANANSLIGLYGGTQNQVYGPSAIAAAEANSPGNW